jgi:hypothetical protein
MIQLTQTQHDDLQARAAQRDALRSEILYLLVELQNLNDPRIKAIRTRVACLFDEIPVQVPTAIPAQPRLMDPAIQRIVDSVPNPVPLAFPVCCPSCGDSFRVGLGVKP